MPEKLSTVELFFYSILRSVKASFKNPTVDQAKMEPVDKKLIEERRQRVNSCTTVNISKHPLRPKLCTNLFYRLRR